jgi:glycosyltransferase involved in cell wall biosynthesis
VGALNVVLVHNRYRQRGGEDDVFEAEAQLLESRGHRIERVTVENCNLADRHAVTTAAATIWNPTAHRRIRESCRRIDAHVVHFHNTFPMISPAGYYAAHAEGAAVVQTLHNFRLVCLNALCFRDGQPCEECLTRRLPWPGVVHGCYRNSRAASGVTAVMLSLHRAAGTWASRVDTYVALSHFARSKFIAGGLPASKLAVKPNFLSDDPGTGAHDGRYALYVGRLSPEKGVELLLRAWAALRGKIGLKVIGSGPLEERVRQAGEGVEWLGPEPRPRVIDLMQKAAFLVFPSEVYENCPMTVIQAFATGLPVVASGHGSIAEMVHDGVTGRHFRPGDVEDLIHTISTVVDNQDGMGAFRAAARAAFEGRYTAARNYEQLSLLYDLARRQIRAAA